MAPNPVPAQSDWLLIEAVLFGLWAPHDGDPQALPELLEDQGEPMITVNDVIRARGAMSRLKEANGA